MILCKCGCGQEIIQRYSWYIPKFIMGHNKKGKTYEELYGTERSKELKGNQSKTFSGKGNPMYGKERPDLRGRNLNNNPMKNPVIAKKNSDSHKGKNKENCESIRQMAEKARGRTKETHEPTRRRSERMKNSKEVQNHVKEMRKKRKNPSKYELKLRDMIFSLYPTSEHTYSILNYDIDIVLLEYKIAIEYDGYYHFDTEEHKEYHRRRQKEIEGLGWKFLRYTMFDRFPNIDQIKNDIKELL